MLVSDSTSTLHSHRRLSKVFCVDLNYLVPEIFFLVTTSVKNHSKYTDLIEWPHQGILKGEVSLYC